ncbi:MAG: rubrerythrin [Firmicutes bacterium]|nr:rubrerythrin [Bacillota bacterium]
MRAWQNSTELTRDFEMYSKRMPQGELSDMFKDFARDEAGHATKLRSILNKVESEEVDF